jgi:hypothetical protein
MRTELEKGMDSGRRGPSVVQALTQSLPVARRRLRTQKVFPCLPPIPFIGGVRSYLKRCRRIRPKDGGFKYRRPLPGRRSNAGSPEPANGAIVFLNSVSQVRFLPGHFKGGELDRGHGPSRGRFGGPSCRIDPAIHGNANRRSNEPPPVRTEVTAGRTRCPPGPA